MTVAARLQGGRERLAAAGILAAELEARLLLEQATGMDRASLLAHAREPVRSDAAARYERLLSERERRVPLAYLSGEREFWSLRLKVDPRVLIPRPETETLVEEALGRLAPGARVADIGTGSGAIVIALARELGRGDFCGTDLSTDALDVARENAAAHGVADRVRFFHGDLLEPLRSRTAPLDALVSNPPYIPSSQLPDLQPEVRDHEPRAALDGGADGLRLIRALIGGAPGLLRPGGWLLLEVGAGQAGAVTALLEDHAAFEAVSCRRDLAGIERVVAARMAA